jgi:hypothetical protein
VWQGNVITGPSGFGIIVYSGRSSFHDLSLAMLCWLTVSKLRNQHLYEYWHDGSPDLCRQRVRYGARVEPVRVACREESDMRLRAMHAVFAAVLVGSLASRGAIR